MCIQYVYQDSNSLQLFVSLTEAAASFTQTLFYYMSCWQIESTLCVDTQANWKSRNLTLFRCSPVLLDQASCVCVFVYLSHCLTLRNVRHGFTDAPNPVSFVFCHLFILDTETSSVLISVLMSKLPLLIARIIPWVWLAFVDIQNKYLLWVITNIYAKDQQNHLDDSEWGFFFFKLSSLVPCHKCASPHHVTGNFTSFFLCKNESVFSVW